MKVFFRKLKRTKLSVRLIYYFVFLLFLVSYILFTKSLLLLNGIENVIRIIVIIFLGTLLLIYWFLDLLLLLCKKYKTVIILSVICMLISCVCIIGSLYINKAYSLLDKITEGEFTTYTSDLVLMSGTEFKNESSFKVGIINNDTDIEGNILAYELINKENIKNISITKYDTYFEMLELLYSGDLNGIFIGDGYVDTYSTYEQYESIAEQTKIQFQYSKKMETKEVIENNHSNVTEPFTMLLIGVDSEKSTLNFNSGFNSDTLMLVTFNPKTLSATVFSIPRDTYVPICNKGISSKINSASAYGGACVVKTVENLTGIPIDFYSMINFQGVVDLVDALGGVTVEVQEPDFKKPYNGQVCEQNSKRQFGNQIICMNPGLQTLNGEQALAYSRCRHLYNLSDFARIQHQQDVVEAMANQMKSMKSVNDFYAVLEAISNNMVTNMSTAQLLSLYNVFKVAVIDGNNGSMINIQKTFLTGYNLNMIVTNISRTMPVYTYQYYESSLNEIKDALNITLGKKKPTWIKTFDYSINETYEPTVIGKSYLSTSKNEALPNFVGKTITEAKEWCAARNITVTTVEVSEGNPAYNSEYPTGTVVTQSALKGTLTSTLTNIVLGVNAEKKTSASSSSSSSSSRTKETSTSSSTSETTKQTQVPTPALVEP
ncbi:MAG: LCP family protein [Bacilli bacterium]|nr:LCP family protein [Bacilli bacterium]